EDVPAGMVDDVESARENLLDVVSEFSDEMMEKILEGVEPSEEEIHKAIWAGVNSLKLTPVFMGSAFKNKGVQALLNGVARYLPSPVSCAKPTAKQEINGKEETIVLEPDYDKPLVCMAFKITDEQFGQLTYTRI